MHDGAGGPRTHGESVASVTKPFPPAPLGSEFRADAEGYFDHCSLQSPANAFSPERSRRLNRASCSESREPIIPIDGDKAGRTAICSASSPIWGRRITHEGRTNDCSEFRRCPPRNQCGGEENQRNWPAHEHRSADEGGNIVAHVRMDNAWIGSINISMKKTYTSRAFDIETKELAKHSQSGGEFFGIHVSNNGKIMIFAGGIPLKLDGKVVHR